MAEYFEKSHDHILRDIRNLECSEEFRLSKIGESSYKNEQNKKQPEYIITRNGFMFLVMGFTGQKAAIIKESFILAFEYMENLIKERFISIRDTRLLTDAIKESHDPCNFYHYSNEFDMMNRVAIGMTAKQFKEKHNIEKGNSIRPYLTDLEAYLIYSLQRWNTSFMEIGLDFQTRKEKLEKLKEKLLSNPPKEFSRPAKLLASKIPA